MDLTGPEPELNDLAYTSATMGKDSSIDGFVKLGEQTFYHQPQTSTTETGSPDLIILCSWLYALPKHISKYTTPYQTLYPSVPIILLKQDGPDLMWRPKSWQMENMKPVVEIIKGLERDKGRALRVLVHVWSNGGSFTITQLADAYVLFPKDSSVSVLPVTVLIIDSAPSVPGIKTGYVAMSQGLPKALPEPVRLLGGGLVYGLISVGALIGKLLGVEGAITGMRRKLNDPSGPFMTDGVQRVYIYSETDELVPWQEVEEHAREAKHIFNAEKAGSGEERVKTEKFVGSRHVGHLMVDADRYWRIVKSFWKETTDALLKE